VKFLGYIIKALISTAMLEDMILFANTMDFIINAILVIGILTYNVDFICLGMVLSILLAMIQVTI
jgi:hypothetical protein